MPRPKPAEDPVQFVLRLSPALLARVDAEAKRSARSRNGVIQDAVSWHVAEQEGLAVQRAKAEPLTAEQQRAAEEAYYAGKPAHEIDAAIRAARTPALQVGPRRAGFGERLKKR